MDAGTIWRENDARFAGILLPFVCCDVRCVGISGERHGSSRGDVEKLSALGISCCVGIFRGICGASEVANMGGAEYGFNAIHAAAQFEAGICGKARQYIRSERSDIGAGCE